VELAELVMAARSSVLSERDLQLLSLLLDSRSPTEVAAAMRVSVRSVSNHRDALVSRLRQTARVLAAA
jgi:DNA-binding CsgD family transcriptional regulator